MFTHKVGRKCSVCCGGPRVGREAGYSLQLYPAFGRRRHIFGVFPFRTGTVRWPFGPGRPGGKGTAVPVNSENVKSVRIDMCGA